MKLSRFEISVTFLTPSEIGCSNLGERTFEIVCFKSKLLLPNIFFIFSPQLKSCTKISDSIFGKVYTYLGLGTFRNLKKKPSPDGLNVTWKHNVLIFVF